jgi:hypothetical protein
MRARASLALFCVQAVNEEECGSGLSSLRRGLMVRRARAAARHDGAGRRRRFAACGRAMPRRGRRGRRATNHRIRTFCAATVQTPAHRSSPSSIRATRASDTEWAPRRRALPWPFADARANIGWRSFAPLARGRLRRQGARPAAPHPAGLPLPRWCSTAECLSARRRVVARRHHGPECRVIFKAGARAVASPRTLALRRPRHLSPRRRGSRAPPLWRSTARISKTRSRPRTLSLSIRGRDLPTKRGIWSRPTPPDTRALVYAN